MAGICTSPYPIEKVGDSQYPYPYPVNAGIPRQNGDGFMTIYVWQSKFRLRVSSITFSPLPCMVVPTCS